MPNSFDYQTSGFLVPEPLKRTHQDSWGSIANPGSFWSGEQRVQIAEQSRCARSQRSELPFNRSYPDSELSKEALEVTHTIAADAKKIDSDWARDRVAAIGSGPYVEIASIVVTVTAIDAFSEALGRGHESLPSSKAGEPSGEQISNVANIGGYIPMMDPWNGPNVGRALSLVPAANALFMSNVRHMYASSGGGFADMVWNGPLSRPQAELLAARVSSVNECFYWTTSHVMLLRESSQAIAQDVELNSTIGGEGAELIPAGQELIDFGEAVTTGGNNLDSARENLRAKLSSEAFIEAAGIAAIFNGLVRTADSTGIPLDDSTKTSSESFRKDLGLNEFPGAANTLRLKKPNGGNLVQQKK